MTTRTFLLAGDSTVATYPAEEHPMSGWGAHLEGHLDGLGTVRNFAKNGATTASFRAEGRWHALLEAATPGDWVLVQFGHNDQKHPELAADLGYAADLGLQMREIRKDDVSFFTSPTLGTGTSADGQSIVLPDWAELEVIKQAFQNDTLDEYDPKAQVVSG